MRGSIRAIWSVPCPSRSSRRPFLFRIHFRAPWSRLLDGCIQTRPDADYIQLPTPRIRTEMVDSDYVCFSPVDYIFFPQERGNSPRDISAPSYLSRERNSFHRPTIFYIHIPTYDLTAKFNSSQDKI